MSNKREIGLTDEEIEKLAEKYAKEKMKVIGGIENNLETIIFWDFIAGYKANPLHKTQNSSAGVSDFACESEKELFEELKIIVNKQQEEIEMLKSENERLNKFYYEYQCKQ